MVILLRASRCRSCTRSRVSYGTDQQQALNTVPSLRHRNPNSQSKRKIGSSLRVSINCYRPGAFSVKKPKKALRHTLVVKAAKYSQPRLTVCKGILQTPWNETCLDIKVSKPSLRRGLGIMAAVIAVLEDNGVKVRGGSQETGRMGKSIKSKQTAIIFGENIHFGIIVEDTKHIRVPDSTPDTGVANALSSTTRQRASSLFTCPAIPIISPQSGETVSR